MTVAYTVLEYGDLIVAALVASDRLHLIYDVENDVRQNHWYNIRTYIHFTNAQRATYIIIDKLTRSGVCCSTRRYYQVSLRIRKWYSVSYTSLFYVIKAMRPEAKWLLSDRRIRQYYKRLHSWKLAKVIIWTTCQRFFLNDASCAFLSLKTFSCRALQFWACLRPCLYFKCAYYMIDD